MKQIEPSEENATALRKGSALAVERGIKVVVAVLSTGLLYTSTDIMGRGLSLTPSEQAVIRELRQMGMKPGAIAKRISRSRTAVRNVLARHPQASTRSKAGRPRKISSKLSRAIVRKANTGFYSARELRDMFQAPVSVRRVQQLLADTDHLEWTRIKPAPRLLPRHKKHREAWAREQLCETVEVWARTIFSDEKRFCLDGPDGSAFYWADKRLDKRYFSRRQQGGGGVMVWGAFSFRGKSKLKIVENTMNSVSYVDTLEHYLLPFARGSYKGWWQFQQDGAPAHTSNYTKEFFLDESVDLLEWPACSPDLNPIENLWAIMVKDVYRGFRQFECEEDLVEAINYAWDNITDEILYSLVRSMPKRCIEVIEKRGGPTHY